MHTKSFFFPVYSHLHASAPWFAGLLVLFALGCGEAPSHGSGAAEGPTVPLPPKLGELLESEKPEPSPSIDWNLPDPAGEPEHPPWFRLVYSQDNRGELEECGCPGSPTGGLARRSTALRLLKAALPDALVVEGPTCLSRAVLGIEVIRGEHRARARLIMELIAAAGATAFFPGQADFEVIGPGEMGKLASGFGLPLVATNLAPESGQGFHSHLLHEVEGRRVLLLGLVGSAGNEAARRRVPLVDAVAAVAAVTRKAEAEGGELDLVLAFTDADGRDQGLWLEQGLDVDLLLVPPARGGGSGVSWQQQRHRIESEPLGRALRRVDVVFTGPPGRGLVPHPRDLGPLHRVASMEELYLSRVSMLDGPNSGELRKGLRSARGTWSRALEATGAKKLAGHLVAESLLPLSPDLLEDEVVRSKIKDFQAQHLQALATQVPPGAELSSDVRYAGHDACIECHPETFAAWARSPHSSSWLRLGERGETRNPECLSCHTTGFGVPGGFVDPDKDKSLLNVQCEACHGSMLLHVEQAASRGVRPDAGRRPREATCRSCHDAANSPGFNCEDYVTRIAHPLPGNGDASEWVRRVCGGD